MKKVKRKLKVMVPEKKDDDVRCGARTKATGNPCQRRASLYNNSGRCPLHGGNSLKGFDSATFKHGKYSKYASKEKVLERITEYSNDDNVRDLRKELAILRGILHSYLEQKEDLLDNKKIDTITKLTDKIEKIVSSLKVIEEGHTFSIKNVNNIVLQLVKIVQLRVTDQNVKTLIAQDVKQLSYITM